MARWWCLKGIPSEAFYIFVGLGRSDRIRTLKGRRKPDVLTWRQYLRHACRAKDFSGYIPALGGEEKEGTMTVEEKG